MASNTAMERDFSDRRAWWGIALLVAAAAIVSHQLLFRPIVGLADNGDYARVSDHLGISSEGLPRQDRYFNFVVRRYRTGAPASRRDVSSEILLAGIARLAAAPFSARGTFDLRWIGAVNALAGHYAGVFLLW